MSGVARFLVGFSSLGLVACAATPGGAGAAAAPQLAGTSWVGVAAGASEARQLPRLTFTSTAPEQGMSGRVQGFTGCNMLSGGYTVEGGVVKLGPVMTTKRFCVGPEMDIERRLLAAMGDGSRITREGDKLVITSANARFEFTPAKPD